MAEAHALELARVVTVIRASALLLSFACLGCGPASPDDTRAASAPPQRTPPAPAPREHVVSLTSPQTTPAAEPLSYDALVRACRGTTELPAPGTAIAFGREEGTRDAIELEIRDGALLVAEVDFRLVLAGRTPALVQRGILRARLPTRVAAELGCVARGLSTSSSERNLDCHDYRSHPLPIVHRFMTLDDGTHATRLAFRTNACPTSSQERALNALYRAAIHDSAQEIVIPTEDLAERWGRAPSCFSGHDDLRGQLNIVIANGEVTARASRTFVSADAATCLIERIHDEWITPTNLDGTWMRWRELEERGVSDVEATLTVSFEPRDRDEGADE